MEEDVWLQGCRGFPARLSSLSQWWSGGLAQGKIMFLIPPHGLQGLAMELISALLALQPVM